jgi:hypothetical protein
VKSLRLFKGIDPRSPVPAVNQLPKKAALKVKTDQYEDLSATPSTVDPLL